MPVDMHTGTMAAMHSLPHQSSRGLFPAMPHPPQMWGHPGSLHPPLGLMSQHFAPGPMTYPIEVCRSADKKSRRLFYPQAWQDRIDQQSSKLRLRCLQGQAYRWYFNPGTAYRICTRSPNTNDSDALWILRPWHAQYGSAKSVDAYAVSHRNKVRLL